MDWTGFKSLTTEFMRCAGPPKLQVKQVRTRERGRQRAMKMSMMQNLLKVCMSL